MNHGLVQRSRSQRALAGVCGGIAAALDVPVLVIRICAVMATFLLGPPAVLAYLIAAVLLPPARADAHTLGVDWKEDGVRLVWRGSVAPHAVPWSAWWGGLGGALGSLAAVALTLVALAGPTPGIANAVWLVTVGGGTILPALLLAAVLGVAPRDYALTLTHESLWLERPLRKAVRVSLDDVEILHTSRDQVTVHLRDGTMYTLPPAPAHDAWDTVTEELAKGRVRVADFADVLARSEPARRAVEELRPQ